MSLTLTLTTPAAATYDLALDANHRYGVVAEDLPDLEQRVEQQECQFEAGELSLTCRNDDGWWDTLLTGADHLARYPSTFSLVVARDGATRWEGDLDLLSVAYDRGARTVSFNVTGKLARLEKYSAESVRRAYPRYCDWGTSTSVGGADLTLEAGEGNGAAVALAPTAGYGFVGLTTSPGKVVRYSLADHTRTDVLELAAGENSVQALAVDDAEEYLYVTTYTTPAKVIKIAISTFTQVGSTLTLEVGENNIVSAFWDATTAHLYVGTYTAPGIVVKIAPGTTTPTRVAALTLTAGSNYLYTACVDSAAGYGYFGCFTSAGIVVKIALAGNMTETATLTFSGGENSVRGMAIDVTGGYLYAGLWLSAIKVVRVRLSDFTRVDALTLSGGENECRFVAVDNATGYGLVGCNLTPGKVVRFALSTFTRADVLTLDAGEDTPYAVALDSSVHVAHISTSTTPSIVVRLYYPRSAAVTRAGTITDTGKAWTAGQFVNHVLVRSTTVYTIVANSATALSVSGEPSSGAYSIRQASWTTDYAADPRKLTSDGPSIADLGLLVGDKLRLIYVGEDPPRLVWTKDGATWWYPFESKEVILEVKHVGPSSYPSLTAYQIIVDQDMTVDFTEGDGALNDTPYHREKTVAQLAALLFEAAGITSTYYTVDVPTYTDNVVQYADFEGMNVADALTELAKIAGCTLSVTPSKYLFQRRDQVASDAGAGGSLDLIATEWAEQPISEQSYDYVRVEGADGQNITRGLVSYLSRGVEFASDWLIDYAWIKQVADRNWAVFGGTRKAAQVKILDGWGQNICLDPSFEGSAAINASACQWKTNTAAGAGETLAKSATLASHLRTSLKLVSVGTSGMGVKQQLTGWTAGETVILSALAYVPARSAGMLHLDLYGKDAGAAVVLDSSGTYWSASNAGFVEKREAVVIPATCTELWVRIFAGGSSNFTAYVDEVRVERATKVAPCLLQRVYLGNDSYQVVGIREALHSSVTPSVMELELLGTTVTAASSSYDTTADDATPPPPEVTTIPAGVFELGSSTYSDVEISWPYPDAPVAKLLYTVWNIADDRPDTGSTYEITPARKVGDATTFVHTLIIAVDVDANTKFVDYMVLYVDGRISPPSEPYIVPDAVAP